MSSEVTWSVTRRWALVDEDSWRTCVVKWREVVGFARAGDTATRVRRDDTRLRVRRKDNDDGASDVVMASFDSLVYHTLRLSPPGHEKPHPPCELVKRSAVSRHLIPSSLSPSMSSVYPFLASSPKTPQHSERVDHDICGPDGPTRV